jgi:hypothetical protein
MATRVTTADFDANVSAAEAEIRKHMNVSAEEQLATRTKATKRHAEATDDSKVGDYPFISPENTPPTRLGSGEPFGPEGQLTVKAAAELLQRGVEIAASPVGEREGLIRATLADIGTLDAGPRSDVGNRPSYSRDKEAEVMGADYDADEMDSMKPIDHLGCAGSFIDDITGCDACDDGKCEECRGRFNKAAAHLSRFAEKVGDSDGDDGERDDSILGESGERVLKTFDEHAADLERGAVRIASNASKPGSGHFGGFPKRK